MAKNKKIEILDSTLRDGAQAERILFSLEDKLKIVKVLDDLGVDYIEGGNPFANKNDMEFFALASKLKLKNSRLCAFGSTRKPNEKTSESPIVKALLEVAASVISVVGKSSVLHVKEVLGTSLEENLSMIFDTVSILKENSKEVIFDAEHFFDGYRLDKDYAIKTLQAAVDAGADVICLCDTNGAFFPDEISEIIKEVKEIIPAKIGIHCHNDAGMAVSSSIYAVMGGACHIQGTLLGFGERCGNANLSTIIPNLQLKKGMTLIPKKNIAELTRCCKAIAEIANISLLQSMPYVGRSAFAHKAGMHIDGVNKITESFEHIEPTVVGNERRILTSGSAGRGTILKKIQKFDPTIKKDDPKTKEIVEKLKELENRGYQFEAAEQSFELVVSKLLGRYKKSFELLDFKIITSPGKNENNYTASAMIKIQVDGKTEITAAEGEGPFNAMDKALKKALSVFYPEISQVRMADYKVRVLNAKNASASYVRVLLESSDGKNTWTTVGVSTDVIEASWLALADSIEYKLSKK
ncbi:MAG: citramalate synthase [Clostridia bacterium]|nr:citramalate synthase [Clostridia bacterium]